MPDGETPLIEVFGFLDSDRSDVRKMAVEGIATNSMNNNEMVAFLLANPAAVTRLLSLLTIAEKPLLGQLLSALINVATNEQVAKELSQGKCINRCIRLYDAFQREADSEALVPLQEMCLMLLNNLTASHVNAVNDFLQVDDEDLKGYNLEVMKTHYDRQPEGAERSQKPWFLKICLNLTRCGEGQEMLVSDEDWFGEIVTLIADKESDPRLAVVALQIGHHCCAQKSLIPQVARMRLPGAIAMRASNFEGIPASVQMIAMETLEAVMTDEVGMQSLEEINAKKYLVAFSEDANAPKEVREFVKQQLLPFLDDINDVFVANEEDE
jgi:hypothetical protein